MPTLTKNRQQQTNDHSCSIIQFISPKGLYSCFLYLLQTIRQPSAKTSSKKKASATVVSELRCSCPQKVTISTGWQYTTSPVLSLTAFTPTYSISLLISCVNVILSVVPLPMVLLSGDFSCCISGRLNIIEGQTSWEQMFSILSERSDTNEKSLPQDFYYFGHCTLESVSSALAESSSWYWMSPLSPGFALELFIFCWLKAALIDISVFSVSELLTLMYSPEEALTFKTSSEVRSSVIWFSMEQSSAMKSWQLVVQAMEGQLMEHLLNETFTQPEPAVFSTRQRYQDWASSMGNQWSKGRQMISLLLTPIVKRVFLSLWLVTVKKQAFLPASLAKLVGLTVFLLNSAFSGVSQVLASSSSTSSSPKYLSFSFLRFSAFSVEVQRQMDESVGFLQMNLVSTLGIRLYQVISPSCRQTTGAPDEYVIVQDAGFEWSCDSTVICKCTKLDSPKELMCVEPSSFPSLDMSLGGTVMCTFFDPFWLLLTISIFWKSLTATLTSPLVTWTLMMISCYWVPVSVQRFCVFGWRVSATRLFAASQSSVNFDWVWTMISVCSLSWNFIRSRHLGHGGSAMVVTLFAIWVPFYLSQENQSKHFWTSSQGLQTVVLQQGKPSFRVILTQVYSERSRQQRYCLEVALRVVVVSTASFLKALALELNSMLNLVFYYAKAKRHRYKFLSASIEFSSCFFLISYRARLVSTASRVKSAVSSEVGHLGLVQEQTLALIVALPSVQCVKKVSSSFQRQYFKSTNSSFDSFLDSKMSTLCFQGSQIQLLEAIMRKCASMEEELDSTACWKSLELVSIDSKITQLGQHSLSFCGSTWIYCKGLKLKRSVGCCSCTGKGHMLGSIERSSDFQTLQTILRSTTEGLQKMVAEWFWCLGRKQKCEDVEGPFTRQLCQIPSLSSIMEFSTSSVMVTSASTYISFCMRTKSQQFQPSFCLQRRLEASPMSSTSTFRSTVKVAVLFGSVYLSALLTFSDRFTSLPCML